MDYEAMSYADAKRQLVKQAEPTAPAPAATAPTAPATGPATWLSDLGSTASNVGTQISDSYSANPVPWNIGLAGLGGAGLGALSSLWQPKRRRNPIGRALTGGLLGLAGASGIAGGMGAFEGDDKAEAEITHAETAANLAGNTGRKEEISNIYGGETTPVDPEAPPDTIPVGVTPDPTGWELKKSVPKVIGALANAYRNDEPMGPAAEVAGDIAETATGFRGLKNDLGQMSGLTQPDKNFVPEMAGLGTAAAWSKFRNRSSAVLEQMQRDAEANPNRAGIAEKLRKTVDANSALRAQARKGSMWAGPRQLLGNLAHGSARRQVLKGHAEPVVPKAGINGIMPSDITNQGHNYLDAKRKVKGGKFGRTAKTGLAFILGDLAARMGLESDAMSGGPNNLGLRSEGLKDNALNAYNDQLRAQWDQIEHAAQLPGK